MKIALTVYIDWNTNKWKSNTKDNDTIFAITPNFYTLGFVKMCYRSEFIECKKDNFMTNQFI